MRTCTKCQKVYADKFPSCPHCGSVGKTIGGLVVLGVVGTLVWGMVSGTGEGSKPAKWESISGTQQGVYLVLDIDANSIQRTSDGVSAKVKVRTTPDNIQEVTYICRAPDSGMRGAVIFNGELKDLAPGTTSDAIMRRVCFGPSSE